MSTRAAGFSGPWAGALLIASLLFGAGYLPWQTLHLFTRRRSAVQHGDEVAAPSQMNAEWVRRRLHDALHARTASTSAED